MRMHCALLRATLLAVLTLPAAFSQPNAVLTIGSPKTVTAKPGVTIDVPLDIEIDPAYHVNSNAPSDPYLIPLRLTWSPGALDHAAVSFPQPKTQKFGFSETPLSVFSGQFRITTNFTVAANAPSGLGIVSGKLRYQACNDHECLPPKTIRIDVPVEITK
jgi:thiol:disulfide interchange protein DsbD